MNVDFLRSFLDGQQELMRFLNALFLNDQTLAILKYFGLAMVVLIVVYTVRSLKERFQPRGVPLVSQRGGKKKVAKEAKKAEKQGFYREAGELYRMIGANDKAIEMFKLAGSQRDVAFLYEKEKKWGEAAQFYESSGNHDKAAMMYQKQGDYLKAGELLVKAQRHMAAAEMFERGESFGLAAELYAQTGDPPRAAACYEKMDEFAKAAEIFEQCYFYEKTKWRDPGEQVEGGEASAYASQAGRLFSAAGQYQRAASVLISAGFGTEAAEAFLKAGDYQKAAELYYENKLYDQAAQAYEQDGELEKSYQVRAEMQLDNGNQLEAAQFFHKAGNQIQAAELYEQLGDQKMAGEMYFEAGEYQRAADIFMAAGEKTLAAKAFEEGKHLKEAAELYQKEEEPEKAVELYKEMGDYYSAGKLLKNLGRQEESITLLQKVDSTASEHYQTSLLLGKIFVERGMLDAARQCYQKLFSSEHPEPEALRHLYDLALAYEKNKQYEEALVIYEKVLAENYSYNDVKARADGLRRALGEVKKALEEAKADPRKPAMADAGGRYKVLKKIGQGGMGVVYQAEDTVLHRIVAYKVLPPAVREHPKILENFLQEARVAASLTHANIVTVYDTGKNESDLYITMEYVDGITLKELLNKQSPMAIPTLIRITKQVCMGLEYAHHRNVIHRDIKPANIMISKDHVVKIMDFGLAKIVNESVADKTTVKGTPMYMSPEQILGKGVDHQSDIYSLGCTLYRMATGRAPFTEGDLYYHHLHTAPAPPKKHNPKIPDAMDRIILKCIEKDKSRRYRRIRDVFKELKEG